MTENPTLIQYLTWRRDEAQKYGPVDCEPFSYEDLSNVVDALTAHNVTHTQAQIDAAAKAIADHFGGSFDEMAKAALTAAAEVGAFENHSVDFQEGVAEGTAATIERCAQVAGDKAAELEAWSHQDNASRLAAEMLRKVEAAIRALATEKK